MAYMSEGAVFMNCVCVCVSFCACAGGGLEGRGAWLQGLLQEYCWVGHTEVGSAN